VIPGAPHDVLLVLTHYRANGLAQAREFTSTVASPASSSEARCTAKGGIVVAISRELGCPFALSAPRAN